MLKGMSIIISFLLLTDTFSFQASPNELLIHPPEHGFVSRLPASKWEEAMITGNGTFGALLYGHPQNEIVILSHEKLFLPEYPPTRAPDLGKHLKTIRELVFKGEGGKAAELAVEAGEEAGIEDVIWTDPLVPACQIEIESLSQDSITNYARSVDYETGEAVTAWETKEGIFHRKMFISRPDSIAVLKIYSPSKIPLNIKIRVTQLPIEDEFASNELIENVTSAVNDDGTLKYTTVFKKKWEGSLKGFTVNNRVIINNGKMKADKGWLYVNDAEEILLLSKIKLSYNIPVSTETGIDRFIKASYRELLERHSSIHGEMFSRFQLKIGTNEKKYLTSEELLNSSSYGKLNNNLAEQLCEAARYALICCTGELPPTLQGIWGGTWRPAWSGDFTHNGNVPSAIASGFNTNFIEVMDAYTDYMYSMFDDFKANARDIYGFNGIFCLSRSSSFGKTYHYLSDYPHMYWFAGAAWSSQFFYDYWQYTGDLQFLKKKTIPFMLAALAFYKDLLIKDESGHYIVIPSYSPEVGPKGYHPVVINATMDIAALKQLLRNLLVLAEEGWIDSDYKNECMEILNRLPDYEIDENGELKEWIYPGYKNNNAHRHASHLYPLFYEVDPDFAQNPELKEAAVKAIENRLEYRRNKNGGEMAFGLVQLGLAAAHIHDTEHAYECVDWLCNSYWSPAFSSYHDPGEIFNVDICGGLPAVVTEMIIQSSVDAVELLPALPEQWPEGEIRGVRTRCGVTVDFEWKDRKPFQATFDAQRNTVFKIIYNDREWPMELKRAQVLSWEIN